jgi:succinate dehydrogenase / fumarate reductase cytochrome b subunit
MNGKSSSTYTKMRAHWLRLLGGSVFRRFVVALLGLGLVGFYAVHASINLPVLFGASHMFGEWVAFLHNLGAFLIIFESMLLVLFLAHLVYTLSISGGTLTTPRTIVSADTTVKQQGFVVRLRTLSSTTMPYTGAWLLAFLIYHIYSLKFGGGEDLYEVLRIMFSDLHMVIFYEVTFLLLLLHLFHGVESVCETFFHEGLLRKILFGLLTLATVYATTVFTLIPLRFYFFGG